MPQAAAALAARIWPSAWNRPASPVGPMANGIVAGAPTKFVASDTFDTYHHTLTKGHCIEIGGVPRQRAFVVCAAGGVVEDGARNAFLREFAQVVDAENHWHDSRSRASLRTIMPALRTQW